MSSKQASTVAVAAGASLQPPNHSVSAMETVEQEAADNRKGPELKSPEANPSRKPFVAKRLSPTNSGVVTPASSAGGVIAAVPVSSKLRVGSEAKAPPSLIPQPKIGNLPPSERSPKPRSRAPKRSQHTELLHAQPTEPAGGGHPTTVARKATPAAPVHDVPAPAKEKPRASKVSASLMSTPVRKPHVLSARSTSAAGANATTVPAVPAWSDDVWGLGETPPRPQPVKRYARRT